MSAIPPDEMLVVEAVRKSFGGTQVLRDISFSVRRGEVFGIIGPSGSGKSTLLRCITQLERVSGGKIRVCGETMVSDAPDGTARYAPPAALRRMGLKIGLVFQNFNLFPHFSVLRNLTEAQIHVLKRPKDEATERALGLLKRMGLESKAGAYPCQLSGGQQQRVGIARALALQPEVLCFDEPTSALDPELTGEVLKVIRDLAERKMTMVVVTHEMDFARELADRILFMDGGVVVESGTADEVISRPKHSRTQSFLGRLRR